VEIPWPALSSAFLPWPRAFALWAYWQCAGVYYPTRGQVVDSVVEIMGLTVQQGYRLLREGEGIFWDRRGRHKIKLRRPNNLRRQAYALTGVAKRSGCLIPLEIYGQGLDVLRAFMAFPLVAARPDVPTPRQYTAVAAKVNVRMVTHWRSILRRYDYIRTFSSYTRLLASQVGDLRAAGFRGAFAKGRSWYRRNPDIVELDRCKIFNFFRRQKTVSLRSTFLTLAGGEGSYRKNRALAFKFENLTYNLQDLLERPPPSRGFELTKFCGRLISISKLRKLPDPVSGQVDAFELRQLVRREIQRLESLRRRYLSRPSPGSSEHSEACFSST